MLAQAMITYIDRQGAGPAGHQDIPDTSRIHEFLRMNPPEFIGSTLNEDPENFMDKIQKVFRVIHVGDAECVELASYHLKGVARIWYD